MSRRKRILDARHLLAGVGGERQQSGQIDLASRVLGRLVGGQGAGERAVGLGHSATVKPPLPSSAPP